MPRLHQPSPNRCHLPPDREERLALVAFLPPCRPLTPASPHTAARATSADGEESVPAVGGSRQWLLLSRPKPQVLPRSYPSLQGWAPVLLRPHPRVFRTPAPLPPFRFDVFARYHLSLICHPSVCLSNLLMYWKQGKVRFVHLFQQDRKQHFRTTGFHKGEREEGRPWNTRPRAKLPWDWFG